MDKVRCICVIDEKENFKKYININTLSGFNVFKNGEKYNVDIVSSNYGVMIANEVANPNEIIENLINTINTIDNAIIEYKVKIGW